MCYSPDLARCDFFLFPKLKRPMRGRRFATIEEIKTASLEKLKAIPKSAYQKGDYFEGDRIIKYVSRKKGATLFFERTTYTRDFKRLTIWF